MYFQQFYWTADEVSSGKIFTGEKTYAKVTPENFNHCRKKQQQDIIVVFL